MQCDFCDGPIHIIAPGRAQCLCGELDLHEPPFPEDFWNQLEQGPTWLPGDEDAPVPEVIFLQGPSTGRVDCSKPNLSNGARTDIARYCVVCGANEYQHGFGHDFEPDIPY